MSNEPKGPKGPTEPSSENANLIEQEVGEEVVLKRRIERRLEASAKGDMPWLRRIVGLAIIAAAFIYGWRGLNQQSADVIKRHARSQVATEKPESSALTSTIASHLPKVEPPSTAPSKDGMIAPIANEYLPEPPAKLDGATLNTISECTKGVDAFRPLDFNPGKIASGDATIESVFTPVLIAEKGRARRSVQLQNVRIRLKSGEELRLHAAPRTQTGQLYLKLFRVAGDGLPEEYEFPEAIRDLKDQPLSDFAVTKFLQLAETPGRALEVERHETWSFPDKAGAQVIWSGNQIFELQVFMREGFLSCSRGQRAGTPTMNCKCVPRNSK